MAKVLWTMQLLFWKLLLFCTTKNSPLIVSNIPIRYFVNRATLSICLQQKVLLYACGSQASGHLVFAAHAIPRLSLDPFLKKHHLHVFLCRACQQSVLILTERVKLCRCLPQSTSLQGRFFSRDRHISSVCWGSMLHTSLVSNAFYNIMYFKYICRYRCMYMKIFFFHLRKIYLHCLLISKLQDLHMLVHGVL